MTQQAPIEVGTAPLNLTADLPDGCYVAQIRSTQRVGPGTDGLVRLDGGLVLFATAARAPAGRLAWFERGPGESFEFRKRGGLAPTWARLDAAADAVNPDWRMIVAIARTGDA